MAVVELDHAELGVGRQKSWPLVLPAITSRNGATVRSGLDDDFAGMGTVPGCQVAAALIGGRE